MMIRISDGQKQAIFWVLLIAGIIAATRDGFVAGVFIALALMYSEVSFEKKPMTREIAVALIAAGALLLAALIFFFPESLFINAALALSTGPAIWLVFSALLSFRGGK